MQPGQVDRHRQVSWMLLVHGLLTAGVLLVTWRFVIHDGHARGANVVIGVMLVVLWLCAQYATFRQAQQRANQVHNGLAELRSTELRLRQLLDDLPDAVIVLARDGRIIELNANSVALTGRDRDDLLGRYFVELFDGGDHTRLVDLWRLIRQSDEMATPMLPFMRPDGTEVILEANTNLPLRDPDRVVIALRDVTVRVTEAHRLEKARERFRLAFHGAPTGMALSTSPDGVLIDVNESLMSMLGRTREDLIGRTVEEISHPDDWQRNAAQLSRAPDQDSDNYRMEKRYVRGDGGVVWGPMRKRAKSKSVSNDAAILR